MTNERIKQLIRVLAIAVAVALWWLSVQFSQQGFNIEVKGMAYVGFIMALAVTVIQLTLGKEGTSDNVTLVVVQLLAYMYGIYTNISGIIHAQGLNGMVTMETFTRYVFPVAIGMLLEITPEPLIVWGITGSATASDFLANLGRAINRALASLGTTPAKQVHRDQRERVSANVIRNQGQGSPVYRPSDRERR